MDNQNKISDFFSTEYISYASYDCTRKIASYIDGLKPTARKIIYTVLSQNINKPIKVDSLTSKVADFTEYIHGQDSISGVIVNITQDFIGSLNLPLLLKDGSFGTRLVPVAAASRYIRAGAQSYLRHIFDIRDDSIIENIIFEGSTIEPKYYVPIVPLLLINGSEGISVGYAQKILPRDKDNLMEYIFGGFKDKSLLLPSYKGFKGKIVQTDENSFTIYGSIENINTTTYHITEVPIGFTLEKLIKLLDKLVENKTIQSYEDRCDTNKDIFDVIIKVKREQYKKLSKLSELELLEKFKLVSRVSENYTCIDANNRIKIFDSAHDLIQHYTKVRMDFYVARKKQLLSNLLNEIDWIGSKINFIDYVNEGTIDLKTIPKKDLIKMFEENPKKFHMKDGSYDYLLNMKIFSLNNEVRDKLAKLKGEKKLEYTAIDKKKEITMWKEDIRRLNNV
jgi:DNA topoisomerase-2